MDIMKAQQFCLESDFVWELLTQIPANVFWKDKNSVYLGCNNLFAASLGLSSPAEIVGRTDYDLPTAKEESDSFRADDKEVMVSQKPKLNIEECQTLSDGKKVVLLTNKVPLLNKENNKIIGVLGVYNDITHLKKIEQNSPALQLTAGFNTSNLKQIEQLTKREIDCLNKFVLGYSAKEIAKVLGLSPRTVEIHIQNIKAKLGCSRRSEVVRIMLNQS